MHLVRVAGAVQTPLALNREQLEALPWRDFAESREVQQDGRTVKLVVRYQGFPLRDLIDRAGLSPDRQAVRRAVVLLTARDGYRVSFSWGELYNSALGDGVILVRSQDGRFSLGLPLTFVPPYHGGRSESDASLDRAPALNGLALAVPSHHGLVNHALSLKLGSYRFSMR